MDVMGERAGAGQAKQTRTVIFAGLMIEPFSFRRLVRLSPWHRCSQSHPQALQPRESPSSTILASLHFDSS